jgi:hypothetical protein
MPEVGEKVEKVYSEGLISAKQIKTDLRKKEPPLVDVKVTNPLTYIKSWWKRIIGNEGIDVRVRVKPLTAIAISIIILTVTLGIGRFVFPFKIPFFVYTSEEEAATSDKVDYRDAAFTGELRHALLTNRYYLTTSSSEAINLQVPENVDLKDFVGRRIFAIGKYQEETRTLLVTDSTNLELLPSEAETIPTVETESNPEPSKDGEETEIPSDTSGETTP